MASAAKVKFDPDSEQALAIHDYPVARGVHLRVSVRSASGSGPGRAAGRMAGRPGPPPSCRRLGHDHDFITAGVTRRPASCVYLRMTLRPARLSLNAAWDSSPRRFPSQLPLERSETSVGRLSGSAVRNTEAAAIEAAAVLGYC